MESNNRTIWTTVSEQHDPAMLAYVSDARCCTGNAIMVCTYAIDNRFLSFVFLSLRFPQILAYYSGKTTPPSTLCQVIALGRATELAGLNNSMPNT